MFRWLLRPLVLKYVTNACLTMTTNGKNSSLRMCQKPENRKKSKIYVGGGIRNSAARIAQKKLKHKQAKRQVASAFRVEKEKISDIDRRRTRSETNNSTVQGGEDSDFLTKATAEVDNSETELDGKVDLTVWLEAQNKLIQYLQQAIQERETMRAQIVTNIYKLRAQVEPKESVASSSSDTASFYSPASPPSDAHKEELRKLSQCASQFLRGDQNHHYKTRTRCHAQQRLLRLLKDKLAQTEQRVLGAKEELETLERRVERKQRRSHPETPKSDVELFSRGTQQGSSSYQTPQRTQNSQKSAGGASKGSGQGCKARKRIRLSLCANEEEASGEAAEEITAEFLKNEPIVQLIDNSLATGRNERVVRQRNIEIPSFRLTFLENSRRLTGRCKEEESLEDDFFLKRHNKWEAEEKRIVRLDKKRQRELELRQKLEESPRYRAYTDRFGKKFPEPQSQTDETFDPHKIVKLEILKSTPHSVQKRYMVTNRRSV